MKYLSKENIINKTVILRCDFNVPVQDGQIKDTSKIDKSLETIKYLLSNNNRVIILSHMGRVKKEDDKATNSLIIVYKYLQTIINLEFIPNPENLEIIKYSTSNCFLVENTRFTDIPEKKESANNLELARYWASFADVFVLDAFASMHRAHSSTAGLSKYLPTYIGFLAENELANLEPLLKHIDLVIMGGAKVDDKLDIIKGLINKCDKLLITGGILNSFLKAMGYEIGHSLVTTDENILEDVKSIIAQYKSKIIFSDRFVVLRGSEVLEVTLKGIQKDDIIYDNIPHIDLNNYQTIFLNGTCGKYEDANFKKGTQTLLNDLATLNNKVYIGGGDTVSAVNKLNNPNNYTYLSSGGGATLEYIAYNNLKALEFIKLNDVDNV